MVTDTMNWDVNGKSSSLDESRIELENNFRETPSAFSAENDNT